VVGCTRPATSRRIVDLPQPEGPTSAMNSPSPIRSVVVDKAGTARSPRPNVTDTSESSIAISALVLPLLDETGLPENAGFGCMRIMAASACKPDASKTLLIQHGNPEKPRARGGFDLGNCSRKLHAIQALNCGMIVIFESA
jgi:hypothetical protein